uniref:Uncharacterized protein n=1 Tax=Panagrolaimus davidi TaxID=227884 RepID=A0A914QX10_9BILA
MNTDELVFFESPNFPKGMTEDCNITFMLENDENITNLRTWIMFTNGRFHNPSVSNNGTEYYPQILLSNIHSFVLNVTEVSINTLKDLSYSSFQGYIIFDDWTPGCPLESISKTDPFVFTDETEILFLIPTFIQTNTTFLSVLKINPEITDAECTFNEDEPSFKKWGINNGYPNNAKCLLNLTLLSSDYLYYISVKSASRNLDGLPNEFGVDRLTLYTRDKNIQMNDKFTQINRIDFEYVLQAHKNGYNKYAALEFISDGSVSSQGFEVNFEKVVHKYTDLWTHNVLRLELN